MNRKGFTLIEIVVSIVLFILISSITIIFFTNNNKNNTKYEKVKKQLVEAASVYLSVEKDAGGNTYENGLFKGGTAVFITIDELYNKGYINNEMIETLEDNEHYKNSTKKYLLASIFNDTEEECDGDNVIVYKNSWDNELIDNVTYLCPISEHKKTPKTILHKILEDNDIQTQSVCSSPGLAVNMDNDGATFYFRGNVDNNYIQYGKDNLGNDLLWRIVRLNGDGSLRIILNNDIDYYLVDVNNNKIKVNSNDNISRIYPQFSPTSINSKRPKNGVIFYNFSLHETRDSDDDEVYYMNYEKVLNLTDYSFKIYPDITIDYNTAIESLKTNNLYSSSNLYNIILNNWLSNDVNLGSLYSGQFCLSDYRYDRYDDGDEYIYVPNPDFKCDNNIEVFNNKDTKGENVILKSNIGFLSYGEFSMAKCGSDSFLNYSVPYLLDNRHSDEKYTTYNYEYEYYTSSGNQIIASAEDPLKSNGTACADCYRNIYYDNTLSGYFSAHGRDNGRRKSKIKFMGIRPVINLDKNIIITGKGTLSEPYKVESFN